MQVSYVKFLHDNGSQLAKLQKVFQALVTAKQTNTFQDEAYWLQFFDAAAQAHFWWPTEAEQQAWLTSWQALPDDQRLTEPTVQPPWHFGSLIAAFQDGDYQLKHCTISSDTIGRLEFEPYGWPYGGNDCFKALIAAFDLFVIDDDG